MTTSEFIRRSTVVHQGTYTYDNCIYLLNDKEVVITCPFHGEFQQRASSHLQGHGCRACGVDVSGGQLKLSNDDFIARGTFVHSGKYTYPKTQYTTGDGIIVITCPVHGDYKQRGKNHLSGLGCGLCGGKMRLTTEEFAARSVAVHGRKYDYSKSAYTTTDAKVTIGCPQHGDYNQRPHNHLNGAGCPGCSILKSERLSRAILESATASQFPKKRPTWLQKLELDCYNESLQLALEYQGVQHEKYTPFFHKSYQDFEEQKSRDERKVQLCAENNVYLIVVPSMYTFKDTQKLKHFIYSQLEQWRTCTNSSISLVSKAQGDIRNYMTCA